MTRRNKLDERLLFYYDVVKLDEPVRCEPGEEVEFLVQLPNRRKVNVGEWESKPSVVEEVDTGWCPFCDAAAFNSTVCRACGRDRTRPPTLEERVVIVSDVAVVNKSLLGFSGANPEYGFLLRDPETDEFGVGPTYEVALEMLSERIGE